MTGGLIVKKNVLLTEKCAARDKFNAEYLYTHQDVEAVIYLGWVGAIFKAFARSYAEHLLRQYGIRQPYVEQVHYCYLNYGDLHTGFAASKSSSSNSNQCFFRAASLRTCRYRLESSEIWFIILIERFS